TRFRDPRDRLRAPGLADRVEIPETLPQQLPQPRRVPRGLHGCDRQEAGRGLEAAMAAHRRLFSSARRNADRCALASRSVAFRRLGAGPRCCYLPRPLTARRRKVREQTNPVAAMINALVASIAVSPACASPKR